MKTFTVDACALIAYLFDEEGADLFENLLIRARNNEVEMIMHMVNLGEVYYDALKRNDFVTAQTTYDHVKQLPIRFEKCISNQLLFKAGELKTSYRMSYADSFAAAQTILLNAELLTTDHKEFEPLAQANAIRIKWLR